MHSLEITEDVQGRSMAGTRCGPDGWLVYAPSAGPSLEKDLVQRGLFWRREDAQHFAVSYEMAALLEEYWDADSMMESDASRRDFTKRARALLTRLEEGN